MFPLYRTCAENLQQTPCERSEEEWMLSGTWCSIEIHKAFQLGYRMIQMVEVWNFSQKQLLHVFQCAINLKQVTPLSGAALITRWLLRMTVVHVGLHQYNMDET